MYLKLILLSLPLMANGAPNLLYGFEDDVHSSHPHLHDEVPRYNFNYIVKDDYGNDFGHEETRDGYDTKGSYYVLLPDGRRQVVTYYVNGDSGFVADVTYEGEPYYPPTEHNHHAGSLDGHHGISHLGPQHHGFGHGTEYHGAIKHGIGNHGIGHHGIEHQILNHSHLGPHALSSKDGYGHNNPSLPRPIHRGKDFSEPLFRF